MTEKYCALRRIEASIMCGLGTMGASLTMIIYIKKEKEYVYPFLVKYSESSHPKPEYSEKISEKMYSCTVWELESIQSCYKIFLCFKYDIYVKFVFYPDCYICLVLMIPLCGK